MSNPVPTTLPASVVTPDSSPANSVTLEGLDHWLKDFQKYEAILAEMAKASADNKFKDELNMMERWFEVLSEPERTASVYTLIQHSTQEQVRFFMAVLQKMIKLEESNITNTADAVKPRNFKVGLRPPSLNILSPGSPSPAPITAPKAQGPASVLLDDNKRLNLPRTASRLTPMSPLTPQDGPLPTPAHDKSWASLVSTPLVPMFQKPDATRGDTSGSGAINGSGVTPAGGVESKGSGLVAIDSAMLEKLATSGLSNDAQLLAVQLVMRGILQPADIASTTSRHIQTPPLQSAGKKKNSHGSWRTPSAKYPGSVLRGTAPKSSGLKSSGLKSSELRSSGLRSSGLKSSGLKSSGLDSGSIESPRVEDFDPELLKDIPAWLRSLRLHKYTACFEEMTWQEMIVLDDAGLEKRGVVALGARRRLLRTFDHVRQEMGVESASSTTATALVDPTSVTSPSTDSPSQIIPQNAAPTTRLSADCPVFLPTGKVPHNAVPILASTIVTSAV